MLGQAGEDITRNLIAGVPFAEKGRALINSYVNGDSYADELAKVRADRQAAERRAQSPAPLRKAPECCSPAARSQRASALLLGPSPMAAASSVGTGAALSGASAAGNDQQRPEHRQGSALGLKPSLRPCGCCREARRSDRQQVCNLGLQRCRRKRWARRKVG
jgi:hypothetical protein